MNLIIDGSNLLHRSFWVAEKNNNNNNDLQSDVLFIFLKSVRALVQKFNPEEVWVAWDKRLTNNSTNFRKRLIPNQYKATRDNERTSRVITNHECIEKALRTLGVKQMYPNVLEADDIISWLSNKLKNDTVIISVDKDLLQLISNRVRVYNPIKKTLINTDNFLVTVGVELEHFVKYKALLGDDSDNIDGVEGFGIQKSKRLCIENMEHILNTLSTEKANVFVRNLKLITLKDSVLYEDGEENCYQQQFIEQKALSSTFKDFEQLCQKHNFLSFIKDMKTWKRYFHTENNLSNLILKLNIS
jgi:DNA polymerase-1